QSGVKIELAALDITDQAAVEALVKAHANLTGVIHAAGISEISTLTDMTAAKLHHVMHAKVAGAWTLHRATASLALDQFVVFSSIASVWGSGGLAHYAAANHFLDGLVAYRRSQGLAAASVHWGPWGAAKSETGSDLNAGMAGGEAKAEIERRGLRSLEPDAACAVLSRLMASSLDHLVVADVEWNRFKEIIEVRRPKPMLSAFGMSLSQVGGGSGRKSAFFLSLIAKEPEQRAKEITVYLQNLMAQVLGRTEADGPVDPNAPLMDMGIDSIMALDIKKRLEADTGERIPATLIFDYPTLNRIAAHFSVSLYSNERVDAVEGQLLQASNEPIAIIGIGSRLPNANDGPA
ncbi:MAG TPA: beta-ketoacyl reductase, partial [Pseudomonadales bacterium]|nr:beta-ketoacyl reductase [Pseudomonadales bacterium]